MNHRTGFRLSRRAFLRSAAVVAGASTITGHHRAAAWPTNPNARWPYRPSSIRLDVTPNPVPVDAPFAVRLSGLAPGEVVTLRGELHDGFQPWTAEAVFAADHHGAVDLTTRPPREGTYAVTDPMGLVWSALPVAGPH
ncbi:MAG: acyl-CoA thioesterase/BAAT N-terminal domain-containing protein, partial [Thermomicrobiales bacterium]